MLFVIVCLYNRDDGDDISYAEQDKSLNNIGFHRVGGYEKKEVSKEILEEKDRQIAARKAGIIEDESKQIDGQYQQHITDKDKDTEKEGQGEEEDDVNMEDDL